LVCIGSLVWPDVVATMANQDLSFNIIPYLDRHMVVPIMEFMQEHKVYDAKSLLQAKYELVSKTKMVDLAAEEYKKLHSTDTVPEAMETLKHEVLRQLNERDDCQPLLELLNDVDLTSMLRDQGNLNLDYLSRHHQVTEANVENLYRFARLNFDCGRYRDAADYLYYYRLLSRDEEKKFQSLWGKLAAEILLVNVEVALDDLNLLKETIDSRVFNSDLEQLTQRAWLVNWSLFIFFHLESNGKQQLIDFFLGDKILNAIQSACPHALRYLTVAAVINKKRKNVLKDVVKVLLQETTSYSDCVIEFLKALYVEFDFDLAHEKLKEAEKVLATDFFAATIQPEFMDSARMLMFETYCRIHKSVDIKSLAQKLDITSDEERKLVDYIRSAKVDAKIDTAREVISMDKSYSTIYQQVIDKTKGLTFRTNQLSNLVDKKSH